MSDWSHERFRRWVVTKSLENQSVARVCCVAVYEKRTAEVAEMSGLHVTVVEEVGREYARRVAAAGRPVPTGPKTSSIYAQLEIKMPKVVYEAWQRLSDKHHLTPAKALRSLVHGFLLQAEDPVVQDSRWVIGGAVVSGAAGRERMQPGFTHGALAALTTRAARLGFTQRELVRVLIVEALAGRRRIGIPVHPSAMFDDAKRYRS